MKNNQNNTKTKEYYIGLDVGTNSLGWAAADTDYNMLKFHGHDMWGARLFDEAKDASARRTARTGRRRLDRRNWRLVLLEQIFAEEITKTDPFFFQRLHESSLLLKDKSDKTSVYTLFNDTGFTDKDYSKMFPTIYHLRSELIHSDKPHDVRLVFLALHHLVKYRGHFLYENTGDGNGKSLDECLKDLDLILDDFNTHFCPEDKKAFFEGLMIQGNLSEKKKALQKAYGSQVNEDEEININVLLELLTGATIQLSKLYNDATLKSADLNKISLKDDLEEKADELGNILEERIEVIISAKQLYDVARLGMMLGHHIYISDAKINLYNKNHKDTDILKKYIRKHHPDAYKLIFNIQKRKEKETKTIPNFAAYMNYKTDEQCSQEEFCKFLKKYIEEMKESDDPDEKRIYQEVNEKRFLTKLRGTDNGLIPYQINMKEVKAILDNASEYLPFLNEATSDGVSNREKITSLFEFKIPYYIGPLNKKSKTAWIERTDEKIYPWNFSAVVNEEATAQAFMENLIGRCTYTGEPVLPMNSLLYSKFTVLNEINSIKINGRPIPVDLKQAIYV